jgi:hypothetical protein
MNHQLRPNIMLPNEGLYFLLPQIGHIAGNCSSAEQHTMLKLVAFYLAFQGHLRPKGNVWVFNVCVVLYSSLHLVSLIWPFIVTEHQMPKFKYIINGNYKHQSNSLCYMSRYTPPYKSTLIGHGKYQWYLSSYKLLLQWMLDGTQQNQTYTAICPTLQKFTYSLKT